VTDRPKGTSARATARLRTGTRTQLEWGPRSLEDAVPLDHPVRAIDAVIEKLKLWVYATSEGISSARELADLCLRHDVYRWLGSGVPIQYRCLSKFRIKCGRLFDDLVTQVLALLMQHSLIELHRIAQDGTRIRASAGAGSSPGKDVTPSSALDGTPRGSAPLRTESHDCRRRWSSSRRWSLPRRRAGPRMPSRASRPLTPMRAS
jgi:transposase